VLWGEEWGDPGALARPEAWRANAIPDVSEPHGLWEGRSGLPGAPRGTARRLPPRHQWVIDAAGVAPAGPGDALDGSRPPHARPDKRPARGAIHALSRADAAHGRHAGLDEAGAMGVGTEAAIRHAPIPGLSSGVHLLHLGQLMGQAGGDHQL
jgi:hypothetical protein